MPNPSNSNGSSSGSCRGGAAASSASASPLRQQPQPQPQQQPTPSPQQQQSQQQQRGRQQRRTTTATRRERRTFTFNIPFFRQRQPLQLFQFQCPHRNQSIWDTILDIFHNIIESFVYLIGPLLIGVALGIVGLLTYSYFTILLPMLYEKYNTNADDHKNQSNFATLSPIFWILLHGLYVLFVLYNILYNYWYCVFQKHCGPNYDHVVRELWNATCNTDNNGGCYYPETGAQLSQYKSDYQNRMVQRIRQRKQQQQQELQDVATNNTTTATATSNNNAAGGTSCSTNGQQQGTTTKRRHHQANNNRPQQQQQPPPVIRNWMLLGPYEWGYCMNSNQPKPPRSHYDHVTRQLILNLDHYCPWMFNVIGYFNYRYFVNFLIYIFLAMSYGTAMTLEPFLLSKSPIYREQLAWHRRAVRDQQHHDAGDPLAGGGGADDVLRQRLQPMVPFRDEKMLLTLSFMLCAAVGVAILILGGFHIYLTLSGQTTIEFHGNWVARRRARRNNQKWKNPYSTGSLRGNWQQVYGTQYRWTLASILPSRREPECLPVPVPGRKNSRSISVDDPQRSDDSHDDDSPLLLGDSLDTANEGGLPTANIV